MAGPDRSGGAGGRSLRVRPGLEIPAGELRPTFARSGGPGGQNVNKVETKVLLRFSIEGSRVLAADQRARLRLRLRRRLTADGELLVRSDRHRSRARNLEDARERLAEIVRDALAVPKERRPTRPHRGAVEGRLRSKRRRSERKRQRAGEDD